MNSNNEQIESLTRELELTRERYHKLIDLHGELQKQNSLLEDRILSLVEVYSNEKNQLEQTLIDCKQQIFNLQETVNELEIDKQKYKDDCNLAVRLLHRYPNEFIATTTTEQLKIKNETLTNQSTTQSQHSVIIPTFPPTFVTAFPVVTTTNASSSTPIPVTANENLRLAESLFKSNTVHRYPSSHFICSNCHQTIKCCDVSVQTSLDEHDTTFRTRLISYTSSDDGLNSDTTRILQEPHHAHLTLQQYQMGNIKRSSQDGGLPSNAIPQMHHV